jgi:hypothetical protein
VAAMVWWPQCQLDWDCVVHGHKDLAKLVLRAPKQSRTSTLLLQDLGISCAVQGVLTGPNVAGLLGGVCSFCKERISRVGSHGVYCSC